MSQSRMNDGRTRKGKKSVFGAVCAIAVTLILLFATSMNVMGSGRIQRVLQFVNGQGGFVVGTDIPAEDITEFYYTLSSSTNPPDYQRYRFYVQDGKHLFYHEKREGDHWPLRETDITVSGTLELTDAQWAEFFDCLRGGKAVKREESADSGSSGPWLFLYWKGDRSKYQQFSFASWEKRTAFEELCAKLKDAQQTKSAAE